MAERSAKIRVLVIQSWTLDVTPIRAALERAEIAVAITRVDIEPALHAALTSDPYDLVIYEPATTTISKAAVESCLRTHRSVTPMLTADDLTSLGDRARELLAARSS